MFSSAFNPASLPAKGIRYASAHGSLQLSSSAPLQTLRVIDAGYFGGLHGEWSSTNDPDTADGYVMVYCIAGTADYTVNGSCSQITQHRFVIHNSRAEAGYSVPAGESWSAYRIRFTGDIAKALVAEINEGEMLSPGDILGAEITGRLEEILAELERDTGIESQLYCSSLLHYVLGAIRRFTITDRGCESESTDKVVTMAIRYMKENLAKKLSLQELTEMTSYSKPHFMMMFKKSTGHSPMGYFNMLKIMKACRLLDTTDLKINQICFAIGINDMFYFSRLFKKHMHISPSAYRDRNTAEANDKTTEPNKTI